VTPGRRRNGRRVAVGLVVLAVLAVGGGFAIFVLTSGDAPPPPTLSASDRGLAGVAAGEWRVRPARGAFAGYRVDEKYLGVGVRTAVGRTPAVTGRLRVTSGRIEQAALAADLTRLRSDQTRRDDALRGRGIETATYPRARFTLDAPVALSATEQRTAGTLELHGRTARVPVRMRAGLAGQQLEIVGRAAISFPTFGIEPPSVAGLVTVREHGVLEFRLIATHA
jgi:polyisoprenoid-binding protein YceI